MYHLIITNQRTFNPPLHWLSNFSFYCTWTNPFKISQTDLNPPTRQRLWQIVNSIGHLENPRIESKRRLNKKREGGGFERGGPPRTEVEKEEGEGRPPPCLKVEVIVCFSLLLLLLLLFFYTQHPPSPSPDSSSVVEKEPFRRGETRRNRRLGPAMCFEWIYMTSRRVAMSLFAGVRAYVRALGPACGQRFPAAADVGPSSLCVPLRDTKLAMIIPYLAGEGRAVSSCRILRRLANLDDVTGPSQPPLPARKRLPFPFHLSLSSFLSFMSIVLSIEEVE